MGRGDIIWRGDLWEVSREVAPDGACLRVAARQVVRVEEGSEAAECRGQVEGLPLQVRHEDLRRVRVGVRVRVGG